MMEIANFELRISNWGEANRIRPKFKFAIRISEHGRNTVFLNPKSEIRS